MKILQGHIDLLAGIARLVEGVDHEAGLTQRLERNIKALKAKGCELADGVSPKAVHLYLREMYADRVHITRALGVSFAALEAGATAAVRRDPAGAIASVHLAHATRLAATAPADLDRGRLTQLILELLRRGDVIPESSTGASLAVLAQQVREVGYDVERVAAERQNCPGVCLATTCGLPTRDDAVRLQAEATRLQLPHFVEFEHQGASYGFVVLPNRTLEQTLLARDVALVDAGVEISSARRSSSLRGRRRSSSSCAKGEVTPRGDAGLRRGLPEP